MKRCFEFVLVAAFLGLLMFGCMAYISHVDEQIYQECQCNPCACDHCNCK